MITIARGLAAATMLAMAGCSAVPKPDSGASMPGPILSARPPAPPAGTRPGLSVPQPGLDGRYATINAGIAGGEALWHVRAALNVAALSCRSDPAIAPAYNRFIAQRKAQLASAYAKEAARLRPQGASALDQHSTRLYNFFAQPSPQAKFCRAAASEITALGAAPATGLEASAGESIARLEAPFTDFYRAYNKYLTDVALWRAANPKAAGAVGLTDSGGRQGSLSFESEPDPGPASGTWSIEIGRYTTREAAEAALTRAIAKDATLGALKPRFESIDGVQLRLRLGFESDRDAALRLCATAAADGYDCVQAGE